MHKFFLIESGTVEEIRAHLTEAIARYPSDKNLHEAVHQFDIGLHDLESFGAPDLKRYQAILATIAQSLEKLSQSVEVEEHG